MNSYENVVIVTHEATTGPALDLRDYLIRKTKNLLFISHPLLFAPLVLQHKANPL